MFSTSLRRKLVVLLLLAFFAAPWASIAAAGSGDVRVAQTAAPESLDLVGRLWSLLKRVWNETGCHIDPSGRCSTGTADMPQPVNQGDEGCNIDPDGRCAS